MGEANDNDQLSGGDGPLGNVTRDTVKVSVWSVGIPLPPKREPSIWPNPVVSELNIDGAPLSELMIIDMVGRLVYRSQLLSEHEVVSLSSLVNGVYIVQVIDQSGNKFTKRTAKN